MRRTAVRLLTFAISTAVAVPLVAATDVAAASRHLHKHHKRMNPGWQGVNPGSNDPWAPERIRPASPVCPGNARGIDCKVWPPPIDEDPDRKHSGTDAG